MYCKNCGKKLNNGTNVCPNCGTSVNTSKNIQSIFKPSIWSKEGEINDTDCCCNWIQENIKSEVRQNFGIGYNERILFIRDTSFWNSRNQGLALTDAGVYCIPDNDKMDEKISFSWSAVQRVEYKDLVLYFWGYSNNDDDYCPIHISYFMKSDDNGKARRMGIAIAQNLTEMAQTIEPEKDAFDVAIKHYDELNAAGKTEEAFQFALSCKDQEGLEVFYMPAVRGYLIKEKYAKAISLCNEGLRHCESTSPMEYQLLYAKYSAYHGLKNDFEARKYALPVALNAPDDLKYLTGNDTLIKEDAKKDFDFCENEYVTHYLEQPYNKRKTLLVVNEYSDLRQERLSVININTLPYTNIEFPIGHPVAYQLYIGHPYIAQKYIPFESYELELIEDKIREFCQIMQSLGAMEITIECLNSSTNDTEKHSDRNLSGDVSYRVVSGSGYSQEQGSRHLIDEISQSVNLHQKFIPKGVPKLPEILVWYPNEPSWQRLYEQRMKGTLLQHEERIETRKNRVLESDELCSIEGEFKSLFIEAKGHWDKKNEEKFALQENAILSIQVCFASLEELQDINITQQSNNHVLTDNENEYVEELKICMKESGGISPGERRLLEKIRIKLGISEIRAKELEEEIFPQLTEAELEYLEEYKACLKEDEGISPKERRLLDKLRASLSITEERGKELEQSF